MNIDTAGKSDYEVLQEIVAQTKAKGSDAADDIERTSEWTKRLYANPEVQAVLQQVTTEIDKPDGILDIKGFAHMVQTIVQNLGDNYKKFEDFLRVTRDVYAQEERLKEDLRKEVEERLKKEAEAKAKGTPEAKEEPPQQPPRRRRKGGPGLG